MNKIEWAEKHEPTSISQNHYIFDNDWKGKTIWMKEKLDEKLEWIYKIYIDVNKENYFDKFIFEIEEYIANLWKKDIYQENIVDFYYGWNLEINNFRDLTTYLNLVLEEELFEKNKNNTTRLMLFMDNCDILDDKEKKELNSLVWYREREIIYFLWIKWEERDYIFHTDIPEITIQSWHDYMTYKIINVLIW